MLRREAATRGRGRHEPGGSPPAAGSACARVTGPRFLCLLLVGGLVVPPASADPPRIARLSAEERSAIEAALAQQQVEAEAIWRLREPDWGPPAPGTERFVWVDLTPHRVSGRISFYNSVPCGRSESGGGAWKCTVSAARSLLEIKRASSDGACEAPIMTLREPEKIRLPRLLEILDGVEGTVPECSQPVCHVERVERLKGRTYRLHVGVGLGAWLTIDVRRRCNGEDCSLRVLSCQEIVA